MKRIAELAFVLMIIISILSWGQSGSEASDEIDRSDPTRSDDWLLLLYMAGDNDLGRDNEKWGNPLKMDLKEIERSMPVSGAKVLALADFYGPDNTYLYNMSRDLTEGIRSATIPLSTMDPTWSNELDMSDPYVLSRFLTYSLGNHTASNIMFVMWDHGSGWYYNQLAPGSRSSGPETRGFAQDMNSGGGLMYLDGFRDAFIEADQGMGGIHMDMIGFDTCSMGMMEVFYQVTPWFDLALGSEDEQPYYGYNYSFVSNMGGTSPLEPIPLGKKIIELFSMEYSEPDEYDYATIALVDLQSLVEDLIPDMEVMLLHIIERMYHNEVTLNHLFHSIAGSAEQLTYDRSDLGDLLDLIVRSSLQDSITIAANSSLSSYNDVIIDRWLKPDGRNLYGTGMSIYLPKWREHNPIIHQKYPGSARFLNFTMDTLWDDMLKEYHEPVERVRVTLNITAMDPDLLVDDLLITVINPQADLPIENGLIHIDGELTASTNSSGMTLLKDMSPGTYLIEVYNGTHVGQMSIKVRNRPPQAVVTPATPVVNEGELFYLDASPSTDPDGDSLTFGWDLDPSNGLNDTDSVEYRVLLSYFEEGTHQVKLTISDGEFSSSVIIQIQVLNVLPNPRLSLPVYAYEDSYFELNASGSWDIGPDNDELMYRYIVDGLTIVNWTSSSSISYITSTSGRHNIEVQVRDPDGDVNSTSENLTVLNVVPEANFTVVEELWEGQKVVLDGSLSTDTRSDLATLNYTWYIGPEEVPFAYGQQAEFRYFQEDSVQIGLRVTDDDSDNDTMVKLIDVRNRAPVAILNGPSEVLEDHYFVLDANSSTDSPWDMEGLNYLWDIGDDGTVDGTGSFIRMNLSDQGSILVRLTVSDSDGANSTLTHAISVLNVPPVPVLSGPNSTIEDDVVTFFIDPDSDTPSDIPLLDIVWDIDGTIVGSGWAMEHVFTTEGEHKVKVTITDDQGASGTDELEIIVVNPKPIVVIDGLPLHVDVGEDISATGSLSSDTPSDMDSLTYEWYLDGEPIGSSDENITFKVEGSGEHTLMLRVTDDEGAHNEASLVFQAEEGSFLERAAGFFTSVTGLLILIGFLILLLIAIYQLTKKTSELPAPIRKSDVPEEEDEEEEEEAEEGDVERDASDGDQDGPVDDGEEPSSPEAEEDLGLSADMNEFSSPEMEVLLPEMEETDMGEPPARVELMDVPEPDQDLFDDI